PIDQFINHISLTQLTPFKLIASNSSQGMQIGSACLEKTCVHVVSTYTIDPMLEAVKLCFAELGYNCELTTGMYGQVIQELMDVNSPLYDRAKGGNYLFIRWEDVNRYSEGSSYADRKGQINAYAELLMDGLSLYAQQGSRPLWLIVSPASNQILL